MDNTILTRLNKLLRSRQGNSRLLSGWVVLSLVGALVFNCEVTAATETEAQSVPSGVAHSRESSLHQDSGFGHPDGVDHCPDFSSIDIAGGKTFSAEKSDLSKSPVIEEPFQRHEDGQHSASYHLLEVEYIVSSPPRYLVLKRLLIDHLAV